jgi:hypothetical protein
LCWIEFFQCIERPLSNTPSHRLHNLSQAASTSLLGFNVSVIPSKPW